MNDVVDHGIRFGRVAAMLPVKDMEKACAFYMKVLGFTKAFENGVPRVSRRLPPSSKARVSVATGLA